MKLLIPPGTLKDYKSRDKNIPLSCECCGKTFFQTKKEVQTALTDTKRNRLKYCSKKCNGERLNKHDTYKCEVCGKNISRKPSNVKSHIYCSHSCSAKISNSSCNRIGGLRRSKLEMWLESKLTEMFPTIEFMWNSRQIIDGLELDIYLPKHKLAFELNGIFHYEPIFGEDKLEKIQTRDKGKFQRCIDKRISLCIIDTTSMKYFKEDRAQKILDIIRNIIHETTTRH